MTKVLEWVRWGLAVLVIPVGIWGVTLDRNYAVLVERVADMERDHREDIQRLSEELKEAEGISTTVQDNGGKLIALSTKMEGMSKTLSEIKELLRER